MRRLQKKRLVQTMTAAVQFFKDNRDFVGVDFDLVRELALRSRVAYTTGSYVEAVVTPQTSEFIREYLPKVFQTYWELGATEYAIYEYTLVPAKENKIQIVFHAI